MTHNETKENEKKNMRKRNETYLAYINSYRPGVLYVIRWPRPE